MLFTRLDIAAPSRIIWMIAIQFASRIPVWSGMMHVVQHSNILVKSYLVFLKTIAIWNPVPLRASCEHCPPQICHIHHWLWSTIHFGRPCWLFVLSKKEILELQIWELKASILGWVFPLGLCNFNDWIRITRKCEVYLFSQRCCAHDDREGNLIGCTCTPCGRLHDCVWWTWCDS